MFISFNIDNYVYIFSSCSFTALLVIVNIYSMSKCILLGSKHEINFSTDALQMFSSVDLLERWSSAVVNIEDDVDSDIRRRIITSQINIKEKYWKMENKIEKRSMYGHMII